MESEPTRTRRREAAVPLVPMLVASVCLAAVTLVFGARAQEKTEEPKSVVTGRAVYGETDRPVRRAKVMLLTVDGRGPEYNGLTNERGEFRIAKVPPGEYIAAVDAPGVISPVSYLSIGEVEETPNLSEVVKHFETISIDGKGARELTVRARMGAAVGGRVTYADGDPAPGLIVHVLRKTGGRYAKTLLGLNVSTLVSARTDDRGVFRVAGLPPGEYVIGVSEAADHDEEGNRREADYTGPLSMLELFGRQLLTTYHPSAWTMKEATVVKVDGGDEREGVDIVIAERATRVVAGLVRGRGDKRPVRRARVVLARRDGESAATDAISMPPLEEMGRPGVWADAQGRWSLKNIPDGAYTLHVRPPESYEDNAESYASANANMNVNMGVNMSGNMNAAPAPRPLRKYTPARIDIEVSGGDLLDVSVELPEGAQISGTVAYEGDNPRPSYGHIFASRADVTPAESRWSGSAGSATFHGDSFTIDGLKAGRYFIHASLPDRGEGMFYVKSLTWRGRDLLREPLEVGDGATVEGVSVVFAGDAPTLRVRAVTDGDKRPARGALVLIAPPETTATAASHPRLFSCTTGNDGTCFVTVAPGDYAVVVMSSRAGSPRPSAEEMARRWAGATRVSLRAGETETVEVVAKGN
ncbi:MAG TPA: carboxypeptidase-like regulatory domain-containing protein [Pyrinomonadaceae bacterium]|nr:carboxypeptidase-like regulatory domain-containing protein [Pyrinomonadaceae bacterium]